MQKEIASQIRAIDADYILAFKGNQGSFKDEAENFFEQATDTGENRPLSKLALFEKMTSFRWVLKTILKTMWGHMAEKIGF